MKHRLSRAILCAALSFFIASTYPNPASAQNTAALHEVFVPLAQSFTPPPTPEQLEREMPYLDMVLDEVLRLYPPAWIMGRRLLTDMRVGGWDLPSGSIVLGPPWVLHRDPRFRAAVEDEFGAALVRVDVVN